VHAQSNKYSCEEKLLIVFTLSMLYIQRAQQRALGPSSHLLTNMESATIFGSVFSQTIKSQHCCSAFSPNTHIVHLSSLKKFRNMMHTRVPVIDACFLYSHLPGY
jgi:hypothetical protein